MEAFLMNFLPRIIPETATFSIYTYSGKSDLLRKLPSRILAYSTWLPEEFGIVVLVDRDDDDVKERLIYRFGCADYRALAF
ncbi:hypothetical protein [Salipiger mucosus]|uniref:hypothetical protein n=1 Tax=Salipiger mucosus TaxID=263378 RepID=UPI000365ECC6|nr:hypothetical protein [Salipiger mucosus]